MPENKSDQTPENHKHEDSERAGRVCMIHSDHWDDDMAWVANARETRPDLPEGMSIPTFKSLVGNLAASPHMEQNTEIFRYAVVFSDAEGKMNILASPGSDAIMAMNLLGKAISLMAFQETEAKNIVQEALINRLASNLGIDLDAPDDDEDKPLDLPGGMYL